MKNISFIQRDNKQSLVTVPCTMKSEEMIINGAKRISGDEHEQASRFRAQPVASVSTQLTVSSTTYAT